MPTAADAEYERKLTTLTNHLPDDALALDAAVGERLAEAEARAREEAMQDVHGLGDIFRAGWVIDRLLEENRFLRDLLMLHAGGDTARPD